MASLRVIFLAAASIALAWILASNVTAKANGNDRQVHRHKVPQHAAVMAYRDSAQFTYRLNPYTGYRWSRSGVTVQIGDWGSHPFYYPYAKVWTHSGAPSDLACNMPSSPCWNQDRE